MTFQEEKVCLVGLGYVGLPLAALLAESYPVVGFDVNSQRIAELQANHDATGEVAKPAERGIVFSSDPAAISQADFVIVSVPTPIDDAKQPDLTALKSASRLVGENLKPGAIVIYESTVYPGCTEEVCRPILEKYSGLRLGEGFKLGYSPERVNPGDREHTIDKITKVVSASDQEALKKISRLYGSVISSGIFKASSIKTAEAAKVIENIKRDLNIALVNELALIFAKLDVNTREVLRAAGTKWNFNQGEYFPGLVGGHCISVDPYYLTTKALELGHHPQVILAGRNINEYMSRYISELAVKELSRLGKTLKDCRVLIMGLTFKENVPDTRNSQAKQVIAVIQEFGLTVFGWEPLLSDGVFQEFQVKKFDFQAGQEKFDAIVVFSPHRQFRNFSLEDLRNWTAETPILLDLKEFYDRRRAEELGFVYQSL